MGALCGYGSSLVHRVQQLAHLEQSETTDEPQCPHDPHQACNLRSIEVAKERDEDDILNHEQKVEGKPVLCIMNHDAPALHNVCKRVSYR